MRRPDIYAQDLPQALAHWRRQLELQTEFLRVNELSEIVSFPEVLEMQRTVVASIAACVASLEARASQETGASSASSRPMSERPCRQRER